MTISPQAFGRRLQLARERLGIPIEAIAESTKIKRSLLTDLERGDVSKWPLGIYRRAFVREYAATIGLPADEIVSEFVELFPEEGAPPTARAAHTPRARELRLTMASNPNQAAIGALGRLVVAIIELSVVLVLGWVVARFSGWGFWSVSGAIALVYYPLAAVCTTRVLAFGLPALFISSSGPSLRELIQLALHRTPVQSADK